MSFPLPISVCRFVAFGAYKKKAILIGIENKETAAVCLKSTHNNKTIEIAESTTRPA